MDDALVEKVALAMRRALLERHGRGEIYDPNLRPREAEIADARAILEAARPAIAAEEREACIEIALLYKSADMAAQAIRARGL